MCNGKLNKKINACYNCGKQGHFACDCIESKVIYNHNDFSNVYVNS